MDKPVLKFLDWSSPLAETAARELRGLGRGGFPVDFSHLQVVAPTAEAGRLLREKLAVLCAESGGATDLRISMPEQLIRRPAAASSAQTMLAWLAVLRGADNDRFPELFRNRVLDEFRDSDEIVLGWGETLQQCRASLAEEGIALRDVAETLDGLCRKTFSENNETGYCRFAEFRRLEEAYLRELERIAGGRPDPVAALLDAVAHPALPEGVERVILIDCADLAGAPRRFLAAAEVEVECWINAPAEYAGHFDDFGRPDPDFWNAVPIGVDLEKRLRIVPRPDQQAKKILELLRRAAERGRLPGAVGILDSETASALETHAELAAGSAPGRRGVPEIFVPRELPLEGLPWSQLLSAIVRLSGDATLAAAAEIWRSPLFAGYAAANGVADIEAALKLLDDLREQNFVDSGEFLRKLLPECRDRAAAEDLQRLSQLVRDWRRAPAAGENSVLRAYGILERIGQKAGLEHLDFRLSESELQALKQLVVELAEADPDRRLLPLLLKRRLAAVKLRLREAPPGAVDAVGFLELPWRSDRTVLIAGFNDENFDSGDPDDIFLPDAARRELGMTTCDMRRAADALRFKALSMSRDLFILCGRNSQSGGNLSPSRLLLQCSPGELPERVDALFRNSLVEEPPPPAAEPLPFLTPRVAPRRMSITGFKTYFNCPLTFYLQNVMGLRCRDPEPMELDALKYGSFTHSVLEECPRAAADLKGGDLGEFMAKTLRDVTAATFGDDPPALVRLQCEMIADSLKYFSDLQRAEFAAGWRIVGTELPVKVPWGGLYRAVFPDDPGEAWRDEVILSGKIDRIDCRESDGGTELRVLDYKTGAKAESPAVVHLAKKVGWGEDERFALTRVKTDKAADFYWTDLQLPLYVLLVRHCLQGAGGIPRAAKISAGYFNLPLELTSTGIAVFGELDSDAVLGSAARCADRMLRRIFVDGDFRPPPRSNKVLEIFPGCELAIANFREPPPRSEATS